MVPYLGDFAEDATVYVAFNTFDSNDPSASATITNLANGDIHVHKDGGATQLTTTGATVSIDFDTITGNHLITIDTSASAEYTTGSDYHVRVEGTTVDAATINAWVGSFSLENRYSAGALRPTTAGRTLDVTATGAAGIDWANVEGQATSVNLSSTTTNLVNTTTTNTDMRGTDNALLAASAPTNFGDLAITVTTGLVDINDKSGFALSSGSIDGIWDEVTSGHVTAGTFAVAITDTLADTNALNDTKVPDTISLANINAEADTALSDFFTSSAQLVDDIWDEVNTSGAHNVVNSTGRQLREGTGSVAVSSGTCQATGQTTSNVRLAASENSTNDVYNHKRLVITAGTNVGFDAIISDYDGTNKDCTISPALPGACDGTSEYQVVSAIVHTETATLGYQGGAVWIDSVGGTAGTELYVNGTADNPVTGFTDAKTIADALGLNAYRVVAGSSVTLQATMDNKRVTGDGYTLALNGQSVAWTVIEGATVTGNDDGSNATPTIYRQCEMGTSTLGSHVLDGCRITTTVTLQEAADYWWDNCYSAVAGSGTPVVDFQSAAETKNLSIRHYSGGVEFQNLGAGSGTHTVSLEGNGQFVTNANCVGGTLAVRGNFSKTLNGTGLTLTEDARFSTDNTINADMVAISTSTTAADNLEQSTLAVIPGTAQTGTLSTTQMTSDLSGYVNDELIGRVVVWNSGTANGQASTITDYASASGLLTFETVTTAPVNNDTFVIV